MIKRLVARIVDSSGRHPYIVLLCGLIALVGSWKYASNLDLRSDFLELLPRDSPGFKAFEHQLGRTGGGATLIVAAKSSAGQDEIRYQLRPKPRAPAP